MFALVSPFLRRLLEISIIAMLLNLPLHADAAGAPGLSLEAGSGKVVTLSGEASNVFVADPKVAEVRPASPSTLFVFGVGPGHTSVAALDATGHVVSQFDVTVLPSQFNSSQAQAATSALKCATASVGAFNNGQVAVVSTCSERGAG